MAGDKHALIEVPDFAGGMSSYLRLGAAAPLGTSAGDDLAARIQTFTDDTRKRDGCPDFVPVAERQAETAKLHTKGGWRDHSDGNRITTTRGDKIEVIGGNYRLLILGRGEHQAGWDVSGGHVTEVSETFAGGTSIEWVQNYDGTWKVVEKAVKGEVHTLYHGDVYDEYYGKIKHSQTGSEKGSFTLEVKDDYLDDTNPSTPQPYEMVNPEITERTWARSIASYTGSQALPVPTIKDVTWATEMVSETHAVSMTETTIVEGPMSASTTAQSIASETTVKGEMKSTTSADTITTSTTAKKITSETHADTDDTLIGDSTSYTKGDSTTIVEGVETTINTPVVNEIVLGAMNEVTVGAETSLVVGGKLDVTVAAEASFSLTASLEVCAGIKVELGPGKVELNLDKTEIALARKVLSAQTIYI